MTLFFSFSFLFHLPFFCLGLLFFLYLLYFSRGVGEKIERKSERKGTCSMELIQAFPHPWFVYFSHGAWRVPNRVQENIFFKHDDETSPIPSI
ncbi:hypothetical protein QBC38DRAFT_468290 [Podospora fimiseda]|uniref:Uncharacterized protein n=1 Tax=Podospora fimiseda TaxID=252190 RepID=A0AAN7BWX3_9PEZI|nr:hypothetical protein QBC38DRAFT_468290 [Podospora fimiseda]